jgi:hypothetical protein
VSSNLTGGIIGKVAAIIEKAACLWCAKLMQPHEFSQPTTQRSLARKAEAQNRAEARIDSLFILHILHKLHINANSG